jgi:hypothetical protein
LERDGALVGFSHYGFSALRANQRIVEGLLRLGSILENENAVDQSARQRIKRMIGMIEKLVNAQQPVAKVCCAINNEWKSDYRQLMQAIGATGVTDRPIK